MTIALPVSGTKTWGRWTILGLGLIAALAAQIPALAAYAYWFGRDFAHWSDLGRDGVAVTVLVCVSTPVQVALLALIARRIGANATDYLGLSVPRKRDVALVVVAGLILFAVGEGVGWVSGHEITTPFQSDIYPKNGSWRRFALLSLAFFNRRLCVNRARVAAGGAEVCC